MKDRILSHLKWLWFTLSGLCLILPIFLPSRPYPHTFLEDPIGAATAVMITLSLPSSLFAIPAMAFVGAMFGISSYSIQGMYLNLLFLFALGYVQWFWIVPRFFGKGRKDLQVLNLHAEQMPVAIGEARISTDFTFFDSEAKTPLERVIDES